MFLRLFFFDFEKLKFFVYIFMFYVCYFGNDEKY